jgi:hypothetical protein
MPSLLDLLDGDLALFSYGDLDRVVKSLSDEMDRVEFKRDWPPNRDLAHDACAMANGLGGVIIVGYEDPAKGLTPFVGVDGSSKRIDAALAAIHALTWPPVHCYMQAFTNGAPHVAVVASIPQSFSGPHEYIGGDKPNLPVRRGRSNKSLTLTEIFALQRRSDSTSTEPPDIGQPIISLNVQDPTFYGVEFTPEEWPAERLVFNYENDMSIQGYWGRLWSPIAYVIRSNGIEVSQGSNSMRFRVALQADGSVVCVWSAKRSPWAYLMSMLEDVYGFSSLQFFKLGLGPRATMRLRWAVLDDDQDKTMPLPPGDELIKRVDFSRDSVNDVLTFALEQIDRLAGRIQPREAIARVIATNRPAQRSPDPRIQWGVITG